MPTTGSDPPHWTIKASDIARCPKLSFAASHYRRDGSCLCVPRQPESRNLRAEARAVEDGHRAFVMSDGSGTWIRVVSDTVRGKWYRVEAIDTGLGVMFRCEPQGERAFEDDHLRATSAPGVTPCKHAALAARRLEREGLAKLVDGLWFSTGPAHRHTFVDGRCVDCSQPEDPFEGLPGRITPDEAAEARRLLDGM